jgi:hypothetical protein
MYCHECGNPAGGKFCSHCGTAIFATAATMVQPSATEPDWDNEVRYEAIIQFPGVHEVIDQHAQRSAKRITAEQFLMLADKLIPLGVPLEGIAAASQTLYARLGIKTGKHQTKRVPVPVSRTIVRVLCSLARRGQALRAVRQAVDGCVIEASLPSDMFSFEGDLYVTVKREGSCSEITGVTSIRGQLFDWGKSNRSLKQLFEDVQQDAA